MGRFHHKGRGGGGSGRGRWRLGMGWTADETNGNGSTRFYVDGEMVGSIPFNPQGPVQYIGNVSGYGIARDRTQPWGRIADFRIYRRALTLQELKFIMVNPVETTGLMQE